ncbi:MAG: hypothetical protein M1548_05780 [Actinobacteria bacterium]|nr:hypothetical protein [Actinomycetota bacterium]
MAVNELWERQEVKGKEKMVLVEAEEVPDEPLPVGPQQALEDRIAALEARLEKLEAKK